MAETKSPSSDINWAVPALALFLLALFLIFIAFMIFLILQKRRQKQPREYQDEEEDVFEDDYEEQYPDKLEEDETVEQGVLLCEKDATDTVVALFQFNNYDKLPKCMEMWNDGATVHIRIGDCQVQPQIKGGGLKDTYHFHSLHFHWSQDGKSQGSFHLLNGLAFPLEAHLVHYKSKFSNIGEAQTSFEGDAIAILCVMFVGAGGRNDKLCPITESLRYVSVEGCRIKMEPSFKLCTLLPPNTASFFRYTGSLSDNTCEENTVWTIFDSPVVVSQAQIRKFRSVQVSPAQNRICTFGSTARATQKVYRGQARNLEIPCVPAQPAQPEAKESSSKSTSGPPKDMAGF